MENESWLAVVGYEGLYEVSDAGRVRSLPRNGTRGTILSPDVHPFGYPCVRLSRNNRKKRFAVHKLAATAYLGTRAESQECRHLNGNPADNRPENLAWGTSAENSQDAIAHGRTNSRRTHCPQGHPYDAENTYSYDGRRYCRACNKVNSREHMRRVRAKEKPKT
jgi:hypothetical protein